MIFANISTLCEKNKISISKLEREIGLGNATIRNWNISSPTVDNLKLVADYFGVTLDEIMRDPVDELLTDNPSEAQAGAAHDK